MKTVVGIPKPKLQLPIFLIGLAMLTMAIPICFAGVLGPTDMESPQVVTVEPGTSTRSIADLLVEKGIIRSSLAFRTLVRCQGWDNQLQAGYYKFEPGLDLFQVVARISRGEVLTYRVTIPEGLTIQEVAQVIQQQGDLTAAQILQAAEEFYDERYPYLPAEEFNGNYRLQGYLFPATYTFSLGTPAREVINQMVRRFHRELDGGLRERAAEMGFSIHEIVTMASIVEKEAMLDEERPHIAAVIHNRLQGNMYIQSCATVQYVLPERKPRLLYVDLLVESPYNTYLYPGLPPGPIGNPGRASLLAVLYPAESDYLFYVARPDGSHSFSRTYVEHLRNQKKY